MAYIFNPLLDDGLQLDGGSSSSYSNPNAMPTTVGGWITGSTFANKTQQEMWDGLLYPELYPTLINPSSTFTLAQEGLHEIGEVIASLDFDSSFSRGSINPQYPPTTSAFRSGLPNTYLYTGTGLSDIASTALTDSETVLTYTVLIGAQNWTGRVAYNAGVQPYSSKGNAYNSPLPAGQTSPITRTITGVYPFFATTIDITTFTQQPLALMNSTYVEVTMVAEDAVNKQGIDFPVSWSAITGVQVFNTISNNWEWLGGSKANSLTLFDVSATTHVIQGSTINYNRFVHNSVMTGTRQLRFYTT